MRGSSASAAPAKAARAPASVCRRSAAISALWTALSQPRTRTTPISASGNSASTSWAILNLISRSWREHGADLPRARGLPGELERAVLAHLPGGAQESAESGAAESAADADPLDSHGGKL